MPSLLFFSICFCLFSLVEVILLRYAYMKFVFRDRNQVLILEGFLDKLSSLLTFLNFLKMHNLFCYTTQFLDHWVSLVTFNGSIFLLIFKVVH